MLSEQAEKFKNSGKTLTSAELVETYETVRTRIMLNWQSTISTDDRKREDLFRELQGLDSIFSQLIMEW